jgi:hypothetical protein
MTTWGVMAAVVLSGASVLGPAGQGGHDAPEVKYAQVVTGAQAQPPLVNARLETRGVQGGLAAEMRSAAARGTATWVAYAVPMIQRPRTYLSYAPRGCRLEPPTDLLVLARFEAARILELRAQGMDCDLNASGMPVVWLTGVQPDDSVAWLMSLAVPGATQPVLVDTAVRSAGRPDLARPALGAVALHAAPSAARTLIDLAKNGTTAEIRGRALIHLGQRAADAAAANAIVTAIDADPEQAVRRRAVQALSQLPPDEGIPRLIELARSHRDADVRRQAMRYLGQSRDPRAVEFFSQVLLKD